MKEILGRNGGGDSNYRLLIQLKEEKFGEVLEKLREISDSLIDVQCRLTALEMKLKK